ncbi:MAG TPA: hypothetical protein VIT88_12420, partial [Pyrinomonadaceae bacterium]
MLSQVQLGGTDFATEVIVTGGDDVELKIKAQRGGVNTGRVVDEDNEPIGNAELRLLKRENGKWVPVLTTWFTADRNEGELKTNSTGAGEYVIFAWPSEHQLAQTVEALVKSQAATARRITVQPNDDK